MREPELRFGALTSYSNSSPLSGFPPILECRLFLEQRPGLLPSFIPYTEAKNRPGGPGRVWMQELWPQVTQWWQHQISPRGGAKSLCFYFPVGKKSFLIVREHKRERCLQFHHVGQLVSCVADSATKFLTDAFFSLSGLLGCWGIGGNSTPYPVMSAPQD